MDYAEYIYTTIMDLCQCQCYHSSVATVHPLTETSEFENTICGTTSVTLCIHTEFVKDYLEEKRDTLYDPTH